MRTLMLLVSGLFLLSCDGDTPGADECKEFPYKTMHNGQAVVCEMIWCNRGNWGEHHQGSGLATLWCDPVTPATALP